MSTTFAQQKAYLRWQRDRAIHEAIQIADKMSYELRFEQLLNVIYHRSKLLSFTHNTDARTLQQILHTLRGLLSVARYHKAWVRTPESWLVVEDGESKGNQFSDLLQHLFCRKPVPRFMDQVWFEEPGAKAIYFQKIYLHLAGGNSIRGASLPIKFTKRMARIFQQAPDHFTVSQAVRWSQLKAMNIEDPFRVGVMNSCLGDSFEFEPTSTRVIMFLAKGANLKQESVTAVLDHLFLEGNTRELAPFAEKPQRFSERYCEQIQQLVQRHSTRCQSTVRSWSPQRFGGFRFEESNRHDWSSKYWTIEELTNSLQLHEEGKAQNHCVAGYAGRCVRGYSSIWSLRSHGLYSANRELTIEVRPDAKMIVEALGRYNAQPKPDARKIMGLWANAQGLKIANWV